MKISVFADGSCWPNPGPEGGWGAVLLSPDVVVLMFGRVYRDVVTNNIAEMLAIINAMRSIPEGHEVHITTDSLWSKNALEGIYNVTKNLDLVAEGREEMARLGWEKKNNGALKFYHIHGHSGHVYNEMADKLAGDPWNNLPDTSRMEDRRLIIVGVKHPLDKRPQPLDTLKVPSLLLVDSVQDLRLIL